MNKKISLLGAACIIIGIAGLTLWGWGWNSSISGLIPSLKLGDRDLIEHEQRWTFSDGELQELKLAFPHDANIQFTESGSDEGYVALEGRLEENIIQRLQQTRLEGAKLGLDMEPERQPIELFAFGPGSRSQITVAVPRGTELSRLDIKDTSGSIEVTNARVQETHIELTSGDLNIRDFRGGQLAVNMTSGDVSIQDAKAAVNLELTSGDIELKGLSGDGAIRSTSGSVSVEQREAGNLDIELKSGDVDIRTAPAFKAIYDVRASSGEVEAPVSSPGATNVIKVNTTSGDIRISE
ncbi:DUF4097 domain-containing protein [Paenibacillus sp. P96]|uniref:DUF4097 domain-containing protein n=1 Tax=Paenibacillus zeirhizosphaerae TaxID=2987519 RepID=A0ABT9FN72_9BACL|nr:DUF4097 family beta strand repeat-containing protein [Paenibacillus sp. P96]MDP4096184.1 DUF4097 domain-containing protein [Paenibacillus sp. P96]